MTDLPTWSAIAEAGNIRNWVDAELGRQGLLDPGTDTSRLSDKKRKAYKAAREGRFGDAADAFLALTRAAPDRVDWVVEAGRCLGRAGRFGDAVDLLDAARKRFVGASEALVVRGAVPFDVVLYDPRFRMLAASPPTDFRSALARRYHTGVSRASRSRSRRPASDSPMEALR